MDSETASKTIDISHITTDFKLCDVRLEHAKESDAEELFKVVTDAYQVEVGSTGVAFNTNNRYQRVA